MQNETGGGFLARLRSWFPDREFFMRSNGQVRFITITTKMQMTAAGAACAALLVWGVSVVGAGVMQYSAQAERMALLDREAKVEDAQTRLDAYSDDLDSVADELETRQDFLEDMLPMLPEDVREGETVTDSESETAATVQKVSASFPEAARLAQIERRQIALAERMTRFADRRAARAEKAIRKLGLNPDAMLANSRDAMGGPFEALGKSIDPRFQRLGASLARMDALERGLAGIPQVMPADINMISSGFGYRRDPFNGSGAMHSGLDFKGPVGAPIHAAAAGKVTFVGYKGGYGKTVEITHGNGMMTRYAHMSRYNAKVGQKVDAGSVIGAIGSTGRSTGPHLHFEVRINNRAVNPRPFLETAPNVLEEARRPASTAKEKKRG
ncbi:M23 family metallopeptidase [Paraurantiacibacter namhicola]|uniref:Murein DD-endopeptidase MepM n=1 Tax=Paraurantiacibacter namhicola TaxID=645517 RepID=A0A1C7D5S8_9SPHN|nr:M23 family metallopeptidase [Paraurantiacibacter namhicola]ANU06712.1 Murein DD-endopeptidase MepM [Paraurantiacibacter namhicola]